MNIRNFYLFRVFFHARFYYPVFAVLFLDLGLSVEQFALLNAIWAATIVLLEVPSGVLADLIGRARLLRVSAGLMMAEMLLILFTPPGRGALTFWMLLGNRIVSGASEAMASGADEALAYDSLVEQDRVADWPHILERVMKWNALAMIVAMITGAILYDPTWMANIRFIQQIPPQVIIKLPVLATFGCSLVVAYAALRMREPRIHVATVDPGGGTTIHQAIGFMLTAARRVLTHPVMFLVILTGLLHDSVIRMVLTLSSEYFRWIHIPARYFGMLGAAMALMGLCTPPLARRLVARCTAPRNFILTATITLLALVGAASTRHQAGFLFILLMMAGFTLLNYLVSYYLNREAESHERATILSFKGLAYNLGYGVMGLLYSGYYRHLQGTDADAAFGISLRAFPIWFAASLAIPPLLALRARYGKRTPDPATPGL